MTNQTLVPSSYGGAPPINVDALTSKELKDLCKGMYTDLSFLAGVVPGRVGSMLSTGITAAAAAGAGVIDGYFGQNATLGTSGVTAAIAVGMAGFAVMTSDPDYREAAAAVARGFGAPILYSVSKKSIEAWRSKDKKDKAPIAETTKTKEKDKSALVA